MASEIKTISDEEHFEKILKTYFENNNVKLKLSNGTVNAYYLGYSKECAAYRIHNIKNLPKSCVMVTKKNDQLVYSYLNYIDKQEEDLFILKPYKFQIISSTRREERKDLDGNGGGKKLIYITNIVTDYLLEYFLQNEQKKLDTLRDKITDDMSKAYDYIKIFFCSDGKQDVRMKYFNNNKIPIHIQNIKAEEVIGSKDDFITYINNIYSTDHYVKSHNYISEIAVPLLYQMKMPYGYIQVNSLRELNESDLSNMKKFSVKIDEILSKYNIFKPNNEKFIVVNVSKQGFAIAFRERKYMRFFRQNSVVNIDMLLPDEKKASIHAVVRHITQKDNKIIAIGFEIIDIDSIGEVNYDEFLETME